MGTDKRERQKEGRKARLEAAAVAQQKSMRRRRLITILVAVVLIGGLIGVYALLSDGGDESVATDSTDTTTADTAPATTGAPSAVPPAPGPGETISGETPCPAADGSSPRTTSFEQAPPTCLEDGKQYTATFTTNLGVIKVALDTEKTPGTANNFAVLSRYHYYDNTAIFRTDPSIDIIQGGSPTTNAPDDPGPGYTIQDEGNADFTYEEGQLVMARSQGEDSAGAQFFFVAGPKASGLDSQGTYVVFGTVTEGLDLVQTILGMHRPDATNPLGGAPGEPVIIESVTIEETPAG